MYRFNFPHLLFRILSRTFNLRCEASGGLLLSLCGLLLSLSGLLMTLNGLLLTLGHLVPEAAALGGQARLEDDQPAGQPLHLLLELRPLAGLFQRSKVSQDFFEIDFMLILI